MPQGKFAKFLHFLIRAMPVLNVQMANVLYLVLWRKKKERRESSFFHDVVHFTCIKKKGNPMF